MTTITRRAAVALAVLGLAAAGPARAEMVYRVATMGEPKTLDPHHVSGVWENYIVGDAFLGLLTDAADATPIPGAAESWQISDDGKTYTFKLRDHQWSDGQPVTADDFVFAFRRILDPKEAAEYAQILYPIKNAEALNSGKMQGMENLGVRAVDPKTLEVQLENPTGYFLELTDPLHRPTRCRSTRSSSTAPTGSSPSTSSATAPTTSSSGPRTRASWRRRTRTSTTRRTSRSTR